MEEEQKPKATQKEFEKLATLEEKMKTFDYSGPENENLDLELLDLLNSYRWFPEIVEDREKCGIVSVLGKVVLPIEFEDIKFFNSSIERQSVVSAKKNGKWGLVKTKTGESVTGFIYDSMPPVSANIVPVKKDGKWGYIKITGESFTPIEFETIFIDAGVTLMNGISVYMKDGKYGVTNGYEISKPVFDEIDIVEFDQFVTGTRNGIKGYIDENGEFTDEDELAYWIADPS